jgi:hypothetical protein
MTTQVGFYHRVSNMHREALQRGVREVRRRGVARRLDKIEKEMGYCEIKLEKERRLRKQILFLQNDIEALAVLLSEFSKRGFRDASSVGQMNLQGTRRSARERFLAAGLLDTIQEEHEILSREKEDLTLRLRTFSGFDLKRLSLEDEKRKALQNISPTHSSKLRRINEDFKRVEKNWNSLTEDLQNLDEGIFFLDRNLDYLKSCRTFLFSAKGNLDLEAWNPAGSLSDLFRHSNIGRAKDMADGADRNLKMAQKSLICVSSLKLHPDLFRRILVALLESLFADIQGEGKIRESLEKVEGILAENQKLVEQVKAKRALLDGKLQGAEKQRAHAFSQLGAKRASRLVG